MKLVADTNVIVSGLLWLGNPGRLLEAAALGQITLYTSPALISELIRTLNARKLAVRVERSGLTIHGLLARYLNVAIVIQHSVVPRASGMDFSIRAETCARHAFIEHILRAIRQ